MSVDDVVAQGAEPLFFLDYLLIERLVPSLVDEIVSGVAAGCRIAGCALIGGEMAEHPGHLTPGSYDLAGFCVGVVERDRVVTGASIAPGDAVIGMASSGLHANGYSLARRVLLRGGGEALASRPAGLDRTLGEELLRPTTIYSPAVLALLAEVEVKGLSHVTGGGIPENLGRILPAGVGAAIDAGAWPRPPIFDLIAAEGPVDEAEMERTFNLGIGMIAVVAPGDAPATLALLEGAGHRAFEIGQTVAGEGVQIRGDERS
jgi:phosphoribosylformylglycinamidine cyclo-ligase